MSRIRAQRVLAACLLAAVAVPLSVAVAAPAAGATVPSAVALTTPNPIPPRVPLQTPGQPVATEVGTDRVTLTWAPSAGPVLQYHLQLLTSAGWSTWISTSTNAVQPTALMPGTDYTVRVVAAPVAGVEYSQSLPSQEATFRTLGGAAGPSCRAEVTAGSGWWMAIVTLRNGLSTPVVDWQVVMRIADSLWINTAWNMQYSIVGSLVTARPAAWNTTLPPGGAVSFGVMGSFTGTFNFPGNFEIISGSCDLVRR